jgi:DNA mismatch repair ATPase MutS
LANPINDFDQLSYRLNHIDYYLNHEQEAYRIHHQLGTLCDIPKTISNLLYRKLRSTLRTIFEQEFIRQEVQRIGLPQQIETTVEAFYHTLQATLKDDEDFADDMNFIRDGVDPEIDKLRDIAFHSDKLLVDYQQFLAEIT